ncbi:MAG: hypothetical protein V1742_01205 [Pseudomonadota bacterium]
MTGAGCQADKAGNPPRQSSHRKPSLGPESKPKYAPGRILIKFKPGVSEEDIKAMEKEVGLSTEKMIKPDLYLMKILKSKTVEQVREELTRIPQVEYSEPDYLYKIETDH